MTVELFPIPTGRAALNVAVVAFPDPVFLAPDIVRRFVASATGFLITGFCVLQSGSIKIARRRPVLRQGVPGGMIRCRR